MSSDSTTPDAQTSPFESGLWQSWTNLERFNWLRSLLRQIGEKPETYEKELKIDKDRIARLAEAVDILETVVKEELEMLEKRVAYSEAMRDLAMDHVLKNAGSTSNRGLPSIIPFKHGRKKNGGN